MLESEARGRDGEANRLLAAGCEQQNGGVRGDEDVGVRRERLFGRVKAFLAIEVAREENELGLVVGCGDLNDDWSHRNGSTARGPAWRACCCAPPPGPGGPAPGYAAARRPSPPPPPPSRRA